MMSPTKKQGPGIEAQCIACRKKRTIDIAESRKLSASMSVPICDDCGMPMIAKRVFA